MNVSIKNTLSCLLLCLLTTVGFAQDDLAARSSLESRFTRLIGSAEYTQYFRFNDAPYPDRFTFIREQQGKYAEYRVRLADIIAMDIVATDTAAALLITVREPIPVLIKEDMFGEAIDTVSQQTLAFSFQNYREAQRTQRMFQLTDTRLNFRIRKQEADKAYPEMRPMPEMKSQPVSIGKYPVTVQQYRTYCKTQQKPMPPAPPWGWHADHPIVGITWQEAKDYVLWLSKQTGHGYDLPPKHVWQYAALDNLEERVIDEVAWWGENAAESTQAVGQKLPNGFGLYDMQGNVWEWLDEPEDNKQRTAAGGSWDSHFAQCQWNSITQLYPNERDFSIGFRVVQYQR